ncbi:MAG TPA: WD40 repeat domain-containing protein [Streptosporangiaceae bacterium]|nr:WD40 repeat domain-containing protein [Streptosporangiaceae bacterium]
MGLRGRRPYTDPDLLHWQSVAGGGADGDTGAWPAGDGGRERAADELASWAAGPGGLPGLAVVTGGPGAGKSVLLASLVLAAGQAREKRAPRGATRGALVQRMAGLLPATLALTAVDAHGLSADQVANVVAAALGRPGGGAGALLADLARTPERSDRVLAVDAVDEAAAPASLLCGLLVPLARQPGLRVVVGARRRTLRGAGALGLVIDLGDDAAPTLPSDVGETFGAALTRLERRAPTAQVLLRALAWARGPGLPWEGVWVPAARALAGDGAGADVTDEDVQWLLSHAGADVVQDIGPGGRLVYRLRHDLLAAALRGEPPNADPASDYQPLLQWQRETSEQRVTEALLATVPASAGQRDWLSAHPYLLTYLAQHAAAAGTGALAALAADVDFLAVADPVTLGRLLSFAPPELTSIGRAYRRALPLLGPDPHANAAYLMEAVHSLEGAGPADAAGAIAPLYRTRLASARRDDTLLTLTGHTFGATCVAFGTAPDGRLLLASGSDDRTVLIWDPLTGAPVSEPLTGHTGWVDGVAFGTTPGGRLLLASGASDHTVRVWDPLTYLPVGEPLMGHTGWVIAVAFAVTSGGQLLLASGSADNTVRIWDPLTGDLVGGPLKGHDGWVVTVAFGTTPGGRLLLASGSADNTIRLWDPLTGAPVGEPMTGHTGWVHEVAFATVPLGAARWLPGGGLVLASGSDDGTARIWDPLTGRQLGEPMRHPDEVEALTMTALPGGGLLVATGCRDAMVRVWDPLTGDLIGQPLAGHLSRATEVAFGTTPAGRLLLASASDDHTVRIWDPPLPGSVAAGPTAEGTRWVDSVAFAAPVAIPSATAPGGLLACGVGRMIRLWNPLTSAAVGEPLAGHEDTVHSLAFTAGPGGRLLLASASSDRTVRVWDPLAGVPIGQPLTGHADAVRSVACWAGPGDRTLLASASDDMTVRVWDLMTGTLVCEPLTGHQSWVDAVAFWAGPDGRPLLASAGGDQTIRLWNPLTGAPARPSLRGHTDAVRSLAFTTAPDGGPVLASGGDDRTVRLWRPLAARPAGEPLTGHAQWVRSVVFGTRPDGTPLLVSGGGDKTVRVWDLDTGLCSTALQRRTAVRAVAATGVMLAIGDDEGACVVELSRTALPGRPGAGRRPGRRWRLQHTRLR